jgi:hypothetical protein
MGVVQLFSRRRNMLRYRSEVVREVIDALEKRVLFTAYYVNASAADGGNGSASLPWNQLSSISAYTGFHSGDVVNLTGAFNNQTLGLGSAQSGIKITSSATNPAQIVESASFVFTSAIEVNGSNIAISNLQMTGPGITASSNSMYAIWFENGGSTQLIGDTLNNIDETGFVFAGLEIQGNTSGFANTTITNCNFSNNQVSGIKVDGSLTSDSHTNLTISHCVTDNNAGYAIYYNANNPGKNQNSVNAGILISSVNGGLIDHCTAIGNCYNSTGAAGIWAFDATGLTIQYCESADTKTQQTGYDGEGFDFDHAVSDSIMQYDYSHGNANTGYFICAYAGEIPDQADTVRYCVSDDDALQAGAGIEIYGYSQDLVPRPVVGANIYNNTILVSSYSASAICINGLTPAAAGACTANIVDNIFYNGTTYSAQSALVDCSINAPALANIHFEGNDYYSNVLPGKFRVLWGSTSYSTLSDWSAATGEESLNGSIVGLSVDPQWINETVSDLPISSIGNLKLSANSPLHGAGLNLLAAPFSDTAPYTDYAPYNLAGTAWDGTGGQDFFGDPVAKGIDPDIGFDQSSNVLILNGTAAGDTFSLKEDATLPYTLDVNSTTYSLQGIDSVIINGSTGNEIVTYDFKNGPLMNVGITFNAGSGSNTLTTINTGSGNSGGMPIVFNLGNSVSNSVSDSAGIISIPATVQTGISKTTFSNITVGAGAEVIFASPSTGSANRRLVVITGSLSLAGKTNAWTGTLDVGANDLDVKNGSLPTLTNQIAQGSTDSWQSSGGIISTAAAEDTTHLTTLGIIQNTVSGVSLYNTFDSSPANGSDVLIKYTYFGDTNLDGVIDGSDYSRIDNGFLQHLTGWINGDFNYDGVVDGSDYILIDNAFNAHGASIDGELASGGETATVNKNPASVPALCFAWRLTWGDGSSAISKVSRDAKQSIGTIINSQIAHPATSLDDVEPNKQTILNTPRMSSRSRFDRQPGEWTIFPTVWGHGIQVSVDNAVLRLYDA